MLRNVHLYGDLANKYGKLHRFDLAYPAELVAALSANFKGFREDVRDGFYRIVSGDLIKGTDYSENELYFNFGKASDIHLIPVPNGAKSQSQASTMKIVAGLALMIPFGGLAIASLAAGTTFASAAVAGAAATTLAGGLVTAGGLATVGAALALGGVSQLLAPSPSVRDYGSREPSDQRPSFLFNGATNNTSQGLAIPVVYGRFRAGTIVISSGFKAEQVPV